MKIFDFFYYIALTIVFFLALLGFDFWNLDKQAIALFFTEFALVFIFFGHIFTVKWNQQAPFTFRHPGMQLQTLAIYLFYFIWAGVILYNQAYFFAGINMVISAVGKYFYIENAKKDPGRLNNIFKFGALNGLALFASMLIGLALSEIFIKIPGFLLWGMIYYFFLSLFILVNLIITKNKVKNN